MSDVFVPDTAAAVPASACVGLVGMPPIGFDGAVPAPDALEIAEFAADLAAS